MTPLLIKMLKTKKILSTTKLCGLSMQLFDSNTYKTYKMWTIFVIQLLSGSNTHTPPLQVMTAARLIIFNLRFLGGYHWKVTTIASNCFRGVTNLFVETSKLAPCVSCSLLIMATVLQHLTPRSGSICFQFE